MLALPSLELARALRHREPVISCRTNSLQVALAAVQAATLERSSVFITLDATTATTLPHQAMLAGLLSVGRDAPVAVVVEAVVPAGKETASWWISHGVLAVTLCGTCDAIKRHLNYVGAEAYAHGVEVGVEPTDLNAVIDAERLLKRNEAAFIRIPPRDKITEMHEYVHALQVPVIAGAMHLTPKKTRDLIAAGCAGLTLSTELEEAFTAGIRTALRSRTLIDPARYLGYGATGVRELVRTHFAYFTSKT